MTPSTPSTTRSRASPTDRSRRRRAPRGRAGAVARARRAPVHPRRRRQRRQLQPCGQRLPQALRHRDLRADRQRLRAHRARQRRGLGDDLRRLAGREPRRRRGRDPGVLGRRRRRRAQCQRQHRPGHRRGQGARRPGLRHRRPRQRATRRGTATSWSSSRRSIRRCHAALRSLPGRRLALPGQPSRALQSEAPNGERARDARGVSSIATAFSSVPSSGRPALCARSLARARDPSPSVPALASAEGRGLPDGRRYQPARCRPRADRRRPPSRPDAQTLEATLPIDAI